MVEKLKINEQFFGMVRQGRFSIFAPQRREGDSVRLTTIQVQEPGPPESVEIDLLPYEGKIIEVSGLDRGDWIYSARVVEEAGPVLSDFLKKVFCRGEEQQRRCALVIGHKKESPGARNTNSNISEFEFNEKLILLIEQKVKYTRVQRVYRRTYATLPEDINTLNPDFVISLHCNAYDGEVSGTEVLYHHKSEKGKKVAGILLQHFVEHLGLPNRGIKPMTTEDRGGYLLRYTQAPCVIAEPFFIDNDSDLARALADLDGLASAYAEAVDEISRELKAENLMDVISA